MAACLCVCVSGCVLCLWLRVRVPTYRRPTMPSYSIRYYNQNRFYRVLPNWVCQWGVNGDPSVSQLWEGQYLPDDPVLASNTQGAVAFSAMYDATKSWSTNRTTELYINYHRT